MKPTTKLYLKTFLLSGASYGLLSILYDFSNGDYISLKGYLISSASFGLIVTLILVPIHIWVLKKNGIKKISSDNLKVSQSKSIKSDLTKSEILQKFKMDPIIGKMKINETEYGILINSGMTWKSWGEEIKIIIDSFENNLYEYRITSNPKFKIAIADYGKNLENVNRIENAITNIA
jgi:hypothetical protein